MYDNPLCNKAVSEQEGSENASLKKKKISCHLILPSPTCLLPSSLPTLQDVALAEFIFLSKDRLKEAGMDYLGLHCSGLQVGGSPVNSLFFLCDNRLIQCL